MPFPSFLSLFPCPAWAVPSPAHPTHREACWKKRRARERLKLGLKWRWEGGAPPRTPWGLVWPRPFCKAFLCPLLCALGPREGPWGPVPKALGEQTRRTLGRR